VPQAYQTSLVYTELISLRCLDESTEVFQRNPKTPAQKVLSSNRTLVFASLLFVYLKSLSDELEEKNASTSGASAALFPAGWQSTDSSPPPVPIIR
jgi:hypothetical protein